MDERTKQLVNLMAENVGGEGDVLWDNTKISELKLIEFDSYRLFSLFNDLREGNDHAETFREFNKQFLDKAKMFTIKDSIRHLLLLTKPSKVESTLKMPFNELFIDFDYNNDDFRIMGLTLWFIEEKLTNEIKEKITKVTKKSPPLKSVDKVVCKTLVYNKHLGWRFFDFMLSLKSGKIIKKLGVNSEDYMKKLKREYALYYKTESKVTKILKDFVLNLILFLNEPRITIYEQTTNNERRRKKGLIPIPTLIRTKIHYGLEDYIEKIYYNGLSSGKLGFSFWVRGHWRYFHSSRFVNMQFRKIWIAPHLVGEGITPPQVFDIE